MNKEDLIKLLSEKYKVPRYTIKQVIESVPRFICESLYKREMKNFIVPKLGKFIILPARKKWIEDNILEKARERDRLQEEKKQEKKIEEQKVKLNGL